MNKSFVQIYACLYNITFNTLFSSLERKTCCILTHIVRHISCGRGVFAWLTVITFAPKMECECSEMYRMYLERYFSSQIHTALAELRFPLFKTQVQISELVSTYSLAKKKERKYYDRILVVIKRMLKIFYKNPITVNNSSTYSFIPSTTESF